MSKITLPHKWNARPYQRALWSYLSSGGKRAVAKWHRRAGKDEVFLHHMACAAHERVGSYWYMLPEASQARKAMWAAINPHTGKRRIDDAFPPEIRKRTLENEMQIEFHTGSTFQVVGSDNFNSLVGSPPIGLVFSEYALSNPAAWGYLRPILLENGGWAGFNSTPRGNNHFKKLCEFARNDPEWFYDERTADQTGVFTPEQLQAELREMQAEHGEEFGKSLWLQEYFCSFDAAVIGSIWGDCVAKARESGRITDVAVTPGVPVSTAWDLGRTDSTAVWFFQVIKDAVKGLMIRVVDYHESNNKDIDFYCDMLRAWGKNNEIAYGTHYLPHDARPRTLAAGGKSILQQFIEQDVGRFVIAPRLDVQEGIQAARATFPYVYFDGERCERGLDCLQHYHRSWDAEKQTFSDNPEHDWSSHGCFVGDTMVLTRSGMHRIMDLPKDGEVLTPCGWKTYQGPFLTMKNAPLVEVEFSDGNTVKCTPDHLFLTVNGWKSASELQTGSLIQSTLTLSRSISMAAYIAYGRMSAITQGAVKNCIEMFGRLHLGLSPKIATSITGMEIPQTIGYQISNVWMQQSIYRFNGMSTRTLRTKDSLFLRASAQPNGTRPRKGGFGIADTQNERKDGQSGSVLKRFAFIAKKLLLALKERAATVKNSVIQIARPLSIVSVKELNERSDVWDITVPDGACFSLANGAVVHNSDAWRYLSLVWRMPKAREPSQSYETKSRTNSFGAGFTFGALKNSHMKRMKAERQARMH